MDKLLTLKETEQLLNVSKSTLQRWDNSGKLIALRTEGGHRRYKQFDIERLIGKNNNETINESDKIIVATYARCSTPDQKAHGDIDRQSSRIFEYCAKKKYKGIITKNYAPQNDEKIQKGERVFYTHQNALLLDTYRRLIDEVVPEEMKKFFLAPLITEASIHVNTSGVFKGFYKDKNTGIGCFGASGKDALTRIL